MRKSRFGDEQIIRNLRLQYGEVLSTFSDEQIMIVFDDWNVSAKDEDFLVWMLES